MDNFTQRYLETALWSSTDDNGEPLDNDFDINDIDAETIDRAIMDCNDFREIAADLLNSLTDKLTDEKLSAIAADFDGQHGHDFWLTRNRHGAGFWDRGYGDIGDSLTNIANSFGPVDLIVDDNGQIYS